MKNNIKKIKNSINKFIAVFMSVLLVIVLIPHTTYAADSRYIYLHISLDGTPNVRDMGDFTATSLTTGKVYAFSNTYQNAPNNSIEFKVNVPTDAYRLEAVNDNVVYEYTIDLNNHTNDVATSARMFSVNAYDGDELIDVQYVRYGYKSKTPYTPVKDGYVFDKWVKADGVTPHYFSTIATTTNVYATWTEMPQYDAVIDVTINGSNPTENVQKIANDLGTFELVNVERTDRVYSLTLNSDLSYSTQLPNGEYRILWNGKPLQSYNENIVINDDDDLVIINFNVFHYMVDGVEYENVYVEQGTSTDKIFYIPQKNGHSFAGWYSEPEQNNLFDFNTKITEETFVYAGFEESDDDEILYNLFEK